MSKDPFDDMFNEDKQQNLSQQNYDRQPYYGMPENNTNNSGTKNGVLSLAAGLFIIADIIAIVIFGNSNVPLAIACMGLLFFVVGIIAVVSMKITWDSYYVLAFPLVGFFMTAFPIADIIKKKMGGETLFTDGFMLGMVSVIFTAAGALMIVMPFVKRHFMLKKCTEVVMARCIYLDSHISRDDHGSTRVYAPKWEYYFGGMVYQHQESTYSNVGVPRLGDEREIYVDPYDPNTIYRKDRSISILVLIIGAVFLFVGIGTFYTRFISK